MRQKDPAAESTALTVIRISKDIIFISLAVLVLFLVTKKSYGFGKSLLYVEPAEEAPGTDVEITINEEDTYETLGELLYAEGIITNALSFRVQGTLYQTSLYPGTYALNTSQTIREMLLSIDEAAEAMEEEAVSAAAAAAEDDEAAAGYEGDEGAEEEPVGTGTQEDISAGDGGMDTEDASGDAEGTDYEVIGGGSEGD